MARATRSIDDRLAALRGSPSAADIRDGLRGSSGAVIAIAAPLVASEHPALADELAPAFDRLCERAVQRDPGCRGKLAVIQALYDLSRWDDVFARAARYVQREPQWGGAVDTAAAVRGLCALVYAYLAPVRSLDVIAELLADPERVTRLAAADALANAGHADAGALLRFKLLTGDAEPAVLSACASSLAALQREDAIEFLARLLADHDERAEVVALALAATRLAAAHDPLARWADACLPEQRRRVGYLALALLRHEPATAALLDLVTTGEPGDASAAATALATFKDDPAIRDRLAAAQAAAVAR